MEIYSQRWPTYAKLSSILVGLIAFFFIIYVGKQVIVPLVFSVIIAILLNPVVNFLCKRKMNRVVAIALSVIATLLLFAALGYFILAQLLMFGDSWPMFKEKFTVLLADSLEWLSAELNVKSAKIEGWMDQAKSKGMESGSGTVGVALLGLGKGLALLLLIPVYTFLFLFYKTLLLSFIAQLFKPDKAPVVQEVLSETKTLIQSYLIGLLIETAIVASLNCTGLFILGIKYALLVGVISALLNLIPYIGGVLAICIPMLLAVATKTPVYALWVFILFISVQIIDNNFIVPKIVASKVKVNALVSIIVVLIGGSLWGIAGMFLALPLTAIFKVIFDRIEPLKPFGFVIGDSLEPVKKEQTIYEKTAE